MTPRMGSAPPSLCSVAWLLVGIRSIPGELRLQRGRLSFVAQGTGTALERQLLRFERHACSEDFSSRLKAGQRATLFDELLADVQVASPWHFFSGGMVVTTRCDSYRFAFGQPLPAWDACQDMKAAARMRRVGKQWIAMLS